MNASGSFHRGGRTPARHELDFPGAYLKFLEFQSIDEYAGDAVAVARIIERDGRIAPDFDGFELD